MASTPKCEGYIVMMEWGRGADEDNAPRFPTKEKALQYLYKKIDYPRRKPFIEFYMEKVSPNKEGTIYRTVEMYPYNYHPIMNITGIRENGIWNVYVQDYEEKSPYYKIDRNGRRIAQIPHKVFHAKADKALDSYYKKK